MIKITVDMDACQDYGQCCFEAEDVFKLDDAGKLTYVKEVDDRRRDAVEAAADVCPMQAITVE
jgi:ferredoxin